MKTIQANAPEVISIEELKTTLQKAGIENPELVPKINGIYWLGIKEGFRIAINKIGIILYINDLTIIVKNYHSLLPPIEKRTIRSLLLKPIH